MSIIERTTNLELTQYSGSPVKAQLYANYNEDMQKIDAGYHTLDDSINGTGGLGERISALETNLPLVEAKADDAVSTANDAKSTADGMSYRVTAVEGDIVDLKAWKDNTVDPTLSAYDSRLDAIELVIDTVSTANINDLIARIDALEQKVDSNTQAIDTLNDNLIGAVGRITDLETELGTTNANLNSLSNRVTVLEECCSEVRTTLSDHNTRINNNASDISALDTRLTRDETSIAGNASDITILATQNNTQATQIHDLYDRIANVDPSLVETESISDKGLEIDFTKKCGWVYVNISGTLTGDIIDDTAWDESVPNGFKPMFEVSSAPNFPTDITNSLLSIVMLEDGTIKGMTANSATIETGESVNCKLVYPCA